MDVRQDYMTLPFLFLASVVISAGDDSPNTIAFMSRKADSIVVATVANDPVSGGSAPISNILYPRRYEFIAGIEHVLKGKLEPNSKIYVFARRIERTTDELPVKKGQRVILFLIPSDDKPLFLPLPQDDTLTTWTAVDAWFGVSPYSEGLEAALSGKLDFITR